MTVAFTIDEAFMPATLTAPPMTYQQFADFCAEHPDLFFETTAAGEMIVSNFALNRTGYRFCARKCENTSPMAPGSDG